MFRANAPSVDGGQTAAGSRAALTMEREGDTEWLTLRYEQSSAGRYHAEFASFPKTVTLTLPGTERVDIGEEAKQQLQDWYGIDHPDAVCACVGGGSNAIGIMNAFLDDERVNLYGYEAGGNGPESGRHAIRFAPGTGELGMFQGAKSYLLENSEGQTLDTYSISAGLDYASVGPEHAWLKEIGRVNYSWATDEEAMSAFKDLCETEGIIPAIESSHAVAGAYKAAEDLKAKGYEHPVMIINISGRGDKDMNTAGKWFGYLTDEQAKALEANGAQGNNADGE